MISAKKEHYWCVHGNIIVQDYTYEEYPKCPICEGLMCLGQYTSKFEKGIIMPEKITNFDILVEEVGFEASKKLIKKKWL